MSRSSQTYAVRVGAALDHDLLPAQREAVTFRGGPLLVLGGAGTGKTTVIEARFQWLVELGCRPERIAVLTPSAARADALRERLEGALERGYEQLYVVGPGRARGARARGGGGGGGRLDARAGRPAGDAARADRRAVAASTTTSGAAPTRCSAGSCAGSTAQGRAGRRRGVRGVGAALLDPGPTRRSSASSPRSTRPTSGCWPRRARSTPATWSWARCGVPPSGAVAAAGFDHLLIDDAQELDLAAARLALAVGGAGSDRGRRPDAGAAAVPRRRRGARCRQFEQRGRGGDRGSTGASLPSRVLARGVLPRSAVLGRWFALVGLVGASEPAARSSSGAAPTSAPRPSRSRPTSSGWSRARAWRRVRSRCSCRRSRARARRSRWRSRSGRSPTAWSARRRSSSAPRSATCWRGCGCWPIPSDAARSCGRWRGRRSSCARSTSRGARRSRGGASSTWSRRSRRPPSRPRCRPRRASGSACS